MILGQIFQSLESWQKLSAINMNAAIAYKILKYTKLVTDEYAVIEKQRVALIHEAAGTEDGEEVRLESGTPEFEYYVEKFNAVLAVESDLAVSSVEFSEVVNAVDEKDESLSVQDLGKLEPFFLSSEIDPPADSDA